MGDTSFGCVYFLQEDAYLVYLAISCWTAFTGVCGLLLFFNNFMTLGELLGAGDSIFFQLE